MSRAMDTGKHIIEGLRDAAKKKREAALADLTRAQRAIERADIEISAFEKALAAMSGTSATPEHLARAVTEGVAQQPRFYGEARETTAGEMKAPGSFSEKWVAVFKDMYEKATQPYSYDDVSSAASRVGSTSGMNSLRAQMMKAVDGGLFERVSAGKFRITQFGLETIGASQKENGPPEGGPEAGEGDTSSKLSERGDLGNPHG